MDQIIQIAANSTSQSIVFIGAPYGYSGVGTNVTGYASRVRDNPLSVACTNLAAPNAVWSSGAFGLSQNPAQGVNVFRFDIPNAWLASGSRQLTMVFVDNTTGAVVGSVDLEITNTDNARGEIVVTQPKIEYPTATTTRLTAFVRDEAGNPVTDATVTFVSTSGATATGTSNGDGSYFVLMNTTDVNGQAITIKASHGFGKFDCLLTPILYANELIGIGSFLGGQLSCPVGFPSQVLFQLVNQNGQPVSTATVVFQVDGEPPVVMTSLGGGGLYSCGYTAPANAGLRTGNVTWHAVAAGYPDLYVTLPYAVKLT